MRFLRLILLFGIAVAVVAFVRDYVSSRTQLDERAVAAPSKIPAHLDSTSGAWQYRQQSGANDEIVITAERFNQATQTMLLHLGGVQLRIEHPDGATYDLITSPEAEFNPKTGNLYSEAEVTVTLGLRLDGADPEKQPTVVRAPMVTFDNKEATCWTTAPVKYEFSQGRGTSVGAFYHSGDGYFHMRSQAYLERDPPAPGAPLTRVWADELVYQENDQRFDLKGNVRLDRGAEAMHADAAFVYLRDGGVEHIEAATASGKRETAGRSVEFQADHLDARYGPGQILEQVTATGSALIRSRTAGGQTVSEAERVDMIYEHRAEEGESFLREVKLQGGSRVRFEGEGQDAGQREIQAEYLALHFKGEDAVLDRIETASPGRLTLTPPEGESARRTLDAERIRADYAPNGALRYLRAVGKVKTENRGVLPALETSSTDFEADVDPETGEARSVHQWGGFRFTRGEQTGSADDGRFSPEGDTVALDGAARVDGPTGSLEARRIELDQTTGATRAQGGVRSVFVESKETAAGSGVFTPGEPVYAAAEFMESAGDDGAITFRDNARLWQQANSVAGDQIRIHRAERRLTAAGRVRTQLQGEGGAAPMAVDSAELDYEEAESRMRFTGGVHFRRGDLDVRSDRLTSWLKDSEGEDSAGSDLERALAEGNVAITRAGLASGQRTGFGDAADYDPASESVLLTGKPARAVRADGSETRGASLAYDMSGDRLVVEAGAGERVYSVRQPRRSK